MVMKTAPPYQAQTLDQICPREIERTFNWHTPGPPTPAGIKR
jgi:hypothetical protein